MKHLIIAATVALASAGAALATPLQDKIDAAVQELSIAYGAEQAIAYYNTVNVTAATNAPIRFDQYNDQTSWYINGVLTHNISYNDAIDSISSQITDEFKGYHYQNNAWIDSNGIYHAPTAFRIKVVTEWNTNGTPAAYFNEDWITGSSVNELIISLSEESYQEGFKDGFENGYIEGYQEGYKEGFIDGFYDGYAQGQYDIM